MPPSLPPSAPFVIAVGGLVASGKSSVARALAVHLGAPHLEADRIRDTLIERDEDGHVHETQWERSFGPLFAEQVYAELSRRAAHTVGNGRVVVIDACFPRVSQRERVRSLARSLGLPFLWVECTVPVSVSLERLAERDRGQELAAWRGIFGEMSSIYEVDDPMSPAEHLRLDTSQPVEQAVQDVLARLHARTPAASPERPDAVTFDCWNTLLFEPSWKEAHDRRVEALAAAAAEAGRVVTFDQADRAFTASWEQHMRVWTEGVATGARSVAVAALAGLGLHDPHPALEHLIQSFQEASHSKGVETLPGARHTLERLTRAGIRTALVCDTGLTPGRVVRRHLEHHGLIEHLEVLVFSDEVGVPKPDPRTFEAALTPLSVPAQRALHVGDLRRTDVAGARGVGMATARILTRHDDTTALPEADHVVDSLESLLAIFDGSTMEP